MKNITPNFLCFLALITILWVISWPLWADPITDKINELCGKDSPVVIEIIRKEKTIYVHCEDGSKYKLVIKQ